MSVTRSRTSVSYLWREPKAAQDFTAGVSLHSHTNQSHETLDSLAELSTDFKMLQPVMRWLEGRCMRFSGIQPDYARSYWTPPLTPRLALDLERSQIEDALKLPALVSITDHDNLHAPLLLRTVASSRNLPISVEWSVPYANPVAVAEQRPTAFHLGIHNLPAADAAEWMTRLNAFTALPVETRPAAALLAILGELHELPGVLIVFNHPLWDLYRIGLEKHRMLVRDFLSTHGQFLHALELNGLRDWTENREVQVLAVQWNQVVVSGGDRHGIEPNANLNLTQATSFDDFVHEVRRERISHVLFMPQYKQPWKHRILQSTLDAIRDYPDFPEGSRRWDDRAYHPDAQGELQPLSSLWDCGRAGPPPVYLSALLLAVRLLGAPPVSGGLRLAWKHANRNDAGSMRAALAEPDV